MSHFLIFTVREKNERHVQKKLEVRENKYFGLGLSGPLLLRQAVVVRDLNKNSDYGRHLVRGKFGPAKNADQKMDRLKNNGRVFRESLDRNIVQKL